jgi:hypothetical protein
MPYPTQKSPDRPPTSASWRTALSPTIDHVALPVRDAEASARHLPGVLGVEEPMPDGPDDDMFRTALGG